MCLNVIFVGRKQRLFCPGGRQYSYDLCLHLQILRYNIINRHLQREGQSRQTKIWLWIAISLLIKDVPFEKVLCSRDLLLNATKDNWSFTLSQGQSVKSPSTGITKEWSREGVLNRRAQALFWSGDQVGPLVLELPSALENRGTERGEGLKECILDSWREEKLKGGRVEGTN